MNEMNLILNSTHSMDDLILSFEILDMQREAERDAEKQFDLFALFQVDLDNYMKIKFALMYHIQLDPTSIENMPYYEFQMHVEQLADVLKKKQAAEKEGASTQKSYDPHREAGKMMSKAKPPSVKTPNFKLPK